jgi:hypothetical protein
MNRLSREERKLQTKATLEREEASVEALLFSKKRHKNFEDVILLLYKGEKLTEYHSDPRIALISKCFEQLYSSRFAKDKKKVKDVLVGIAVPYKLLGVEYLQALINIVGAREYWLNDIYNWKPAARQKYLQIGEMINYLFCKYPVPDYLHRAFDSNGNKLYVKWLVHLGRGGRPKELENIPLPLTNKGLHYLTQGNGTMSIAETLRWAQAKSLNAENELANRIALSWLGTKPYEDEEFWYEFIQKVVNGGMFDMEELDGLIDYVRDERRTNPLYSLKGRTLTSLLRQSEEWHNRVSTRKSTTVLQWKPSGIYGYELEKTGGTVIKIEELTEHKELVNESRTMRHCVQTYSYYCSQGLSTIFSMRSYIDGVLLETMATIEVNLQSGTIVQAKGNMNRPVSAAAKKYMETWAAKQRLEISKYL